MSRRRPPIALLLFGSLMLCGLIAYVASPSGFDGDPPRVHFEIAAPERATMRESVYLEVRVQNLDTKPIRDLGIKINRAYANAMTVIDVVPRAQIDDSSTDKRLYVGPLGPGEGKVYRITLSPQRVGEVALTVRLVAAQRGVDPAPLVDAPTGKTELTATTTVTERTRQ